MVKRWFTMLLLLCVTSLIFIGCHKKNVGTSEDNAIVEDLEEETSTYKFGFSCITMQNPYFITLEHSLRDTLEQNGHTLLVEDPALDVQQQIRQIHAMITEGIDAIFLCPVDWKEITPALEDLKNAGVKIINIDSEVWEFDYVDAFIGSNNKEAGRICALDLIERFPAGGKIAILESPTQNSINDRITGFEETIAGKGFEIAARYDVKGDLNLAREAAMEILEEHPDIVAMMCGNDQIALGALVAANTRKESNVKIYGVDGSPDLKKELVKGNTLIQGTSAQSPINMGVHAAEIGMRMLNGEKYEKITYEEVFFITSENVDLYGIDGW